MGCSSCTAGCTASYAPKRCPACERTTWRTSHELPQRKLLKASRSGLLARPGAGGHGSNQPCILLVSLCEGTGRFLKLFPAGRDNVFSYSYHLPFVIAAVIAFGFTKKGHDRGRRTQISVYRVDSAPVMLMYGHGRPMASLSSFVSCPPTLADSPVGSSAHLSAAQSAVCPAVRPLVAELRIMSCLRATPV